MYTWVKKHDYFLYVPMCIRKYMGMSGNLYVLNNVYSSCIHTSNIDWITYLVTSTFDNVISFLKSIFFSTKSIYNDTLNIFFSDPFTNQTLPETVPVEQRPKVPVLYPSLLFKFGSG